MKDFLQAFGLIFIAEMGDKTQIMAMAFATKYKVRSILAGVMIGSFLNHGIAILLGSMLNRVIPIDGLQLVAGVLFVAFGLMSLSIVEDEENKGFGKKYGAIITVAIAFFLGELGDKTQLTALTLSTQSAFPALTLAGTVSGMVVVSSFGIFVGAKLGDRIPEHIIKIMAFMIFMIFGLSKIFMSEYVRSMGTVFVVLLTGVIMALTAFRVVIFRRQLSEVSLSALRVTASDLKAFRSTLKNNVDSLCKECEVCSEEECLVGYMKNLLSEKVDPKMIDQEYIDKMLNKHFDVIRAKMIKDILDQYFMDNPGEREYNLELKNIELILKQIIDKDHSSLFNIIKNS